MNHHLNTLKEIAPIVGVAVMVIIYLMQKKDTNLDNKADKDQCSKFKTRIGVESDTHREHIIAIKEDIGYLKGSADNTLQALTRIENRIK